MVQRASMDFRASEEDREKLRQDAKAAGFKANVSAYIRHKLGLPPATRGRPPGAKNKPKL